MNNVDVVGSSKSSFVGLPFLPGDGGRGDAQINCGGGGSKRSGNLGFGPMTCGKSHSF